MSDSAVGIRESSTPTHKVDNEAVTTSLGVVQRQRTRLGGAAANELADVKAGAPAADAMGLVVRIAGAVDAGAPSDPATETTAAAVRAATEATAGGVALLTSAAAGAGLKTSDDYQGGETLAAQVGAGGVLTFTFSAAVQLAFVQLTGASMQGRATPFASETPTSTLGIPCDDGVAVPLLAPTSSVKVFAPSGASVSVWGYRRA